MCYRVLLVALAIDAICVLSNACGVPLVEPRLVEARIYGGTEAIPGSWPWTVGLFVANGSSPSSPRLLHDSDAYNCVGALIDDQTVVTAAHCIAGLEAVNIRIMLGAHDLTKQEAGRKRANVSWTCVHPEWIPTKSDDVGLVRLDSPVSFSRTIQAVCLSSGTPVIKPDEDLFVTGWGITSPLDDKASSVLKQARQTIIARNVCATMGRPELTSILCANHDEGSTCKGDSGGPLVLRVRDTWQLEGIVSAGPALCGTESSPLYYTQASVYKEWISSVLRSDSREKLCRSTDQRP